MEVGPMFQELMSHEMTAVVVPMAIFAVIVVLLIRKLISFGILLVLLIFAIVAGLSIANYDIFRDRMDKNTVEKIDAVQESFDKFTESVLELLKEMRAELATHSALMEEVAAKVASSPADGESRIVPPPSTKQPLDAPWSKPKEAQTEKPASEEAGWQPPVSGSSEQDKPKFPWE